MKELEARYRCGCEVFDGSALRCAMHNEPLVVNLPYALPATSSRVERQLEARKKLEERRRLTPKPVGNFIKFDPPDMIARDCPITAREYQIAQMVYEGASDQAIANSLIISPNTVRAHINNIASKVASEVRSTVTVAGELKPRQRISHWYQRWTSSRASGDRGPPEVFLYFVQANGGGDHIKIGISTDPHARMYAMQCGSPLKLRLLGFVRGGAAMEQALHERFSNIRLHNEWFAPAEDLLALIAELLTHGHLDAA